MTAGQVFSACFPATVSSLSASRRFIRNILRRLYLEEYETDIQLAIGEVMQNIVRHGYQGGDKNGSIKMKICFNFDSRFIYILIRDTAPPALSADRDPALPCRKPEEGGIGLHLIHAICDKYEVTTGEDGNLFSVVINLDGSGGKMNRRLRQSGVVIPKLKYLVRRWPNCLYHLEGVIRQRQLPDMLAVTLWAGGIPPYIPQKFSNRLMRQVSANPHSNSYHHPWHTLAVVLQAALISRWAELDKRDHQLLILAAICHDLGHRGRFSTSIHGGEEHRSARMAMHLLFLRTGAGRICRKLAQMVVQTARNTSGKKPCPDKITAILRDADIFGSIFYRPQHVARFTKSVLREQSDRKHPRGEHQSAFEEFVGSLFRQGFDHQATKEMAAQIGNYPAAICFKSTECVRLGFPPRVIPRLRAGASARQSSDETAR